MGESKHYLANPEVSLRDEGEDGALLFNPDTDNLVVINPTGRIIWNFLATPHSRDEIAVHLTTIYQGVNLEQAFNDVEGFIQELKPGFVLETENAAG